MNVSSAAAPLQTEVVIVGAGPIGIEMAVGFQRAGISCEVLEAGALGQTMTWWAPQTRWFSSNERISIAGVPLLTVDQTKATREQYLTYLRGVAEQFKLSVRCFEPVVEIRPQVDRFTLVTGDSQTGRQYECGKVVLAIGGTDRPKRLNIPGETLPHVDGYLREPHRYWGRRVLIIGGRNSAVEAALRLHHAGAHVSLSYRGESLPEDGIKYWMLPEIRGLLASGRITPYLGTYPTRITPDRVYLTNAYSAVVAVDGEFAQQEISLHQSSRQETAVEVDQVLSLIGYEQNKHLFRTAGIELIGENQRPRFNEATMESDVPGIYVAGTAVAGTQTSRYKTFLENCHQHVGKIVAHVTGRSTGTEAPAYHQQIAMHPES